MGKFLSISLRFSNDWISISEVIFKSTPVSDVIPVEDVEITTKFEMTRSPVLPEENKDKKGEKIMKPSISLLLWFGITIPYCSAAVSQNFHTQLFYNCIVSDYLILFEKDPLLFCTLLLYNNDPPLLPPICHLEKKGIRFDKSLRKLGAFSKVNKTSPNSCWFSKEKEKGDYGNLISSGYCSFSPILLRTVPLLMLVLSSVVDNVVVVGGKGDEDQTLNDNRVVGPGNRHVEGNSVKKNEENTGGMEFEILVGILTAMTVLFVFLLCVSVALIIYNRRNKLTQSQAQLAAPFPLSMKVGRQHLSRHGDGRMIFFSPLIFRAFWFTRQAWEATAEEEAFKLPITTAT